MPGSAAVDWTVDRWGAGRCEQREFQWLRRVQSRYWAFDWDVLRRVEIIETGKVQALSQHEQSRGWALGWDVLSHAKIIEAWEVQALVAWAVERLGVWLRCFGPCRDYWDWEVQALVAWAVERLCVWLRCFGLCRDYRDWKVQALMAWDESLGGRDEGWHVAIG